MDLKKVTNQKPKQEAINATSDNVQEEVINALLSTTKFKLPISLRVDNKWLKIDALLDTGASSNFINHKLIDNLQLPMYELDRPRIIKNVDGTMNKGTLLKEGANVNIKYSDNSSETINFISADISSEDLILGQKWFRETNPSIDWKNLTWTRNNNTLELI